MSNENVFTDWSTLIKNFRLEDTGISHVHLYFSRDGYNVCKFFNHNGLIAEGNSGRSMQEAVEGCISEWEIWVSSRLKKPGKCNRCGVEHWKHKHKKLYMTCVSDNYISQGSDKREI